MCSLNSSFFLRLLQIKKQIWREQEALKKFDRKLDRLVTIRLGELTNLSSSLN